MRPSSTWSLVMAGRSASDRHTLGSVAKLWNPCNVLKDDG